MAATKSRVPVQLMKHQSAGVVVLDVVLGMQNADPATLQGLADNLPVKGTARTTFGARDLWRMVRAP